jgi:hypothetical protein
MTSQFTDLNIMIGTRLKETIAIAAVVLSTASAFTASCRFLSTTQHQTAYNKHASSIFAEESPSSSSTSAGPLAAKPIEEGSHDELMYALGVNLARQLGDIRPLVENSQELTQLARGLLDAAVGKLDEEGQMKLLGRRGDDLNKVIIERAYVLMYGFK